MTRCNNTFLPRVSPGESPSTMNPVKALPVGVFGSGSVRAKTKNHLAGPPPVIHILEPLRIHSLPVMGNIRSHTIQSTLLFSSSFDARNIRSATGFGRAKCLKYCTIVSFYRNTAIIGSATKLPRYFFCSSFPATKIGADPSVGPTMAVTTPEQP